MKLAGMHLPQRDGVTCGPAVAVVGGALLDPGYRAALLEPGAHNVHSTGLAWFAVEQRRVHAEVNRIWPRRLGATPMGVARALTGYGSALGLRYRWRPFLGRRDSLADVLAAVDAGRPVAMLIGQFIPRHWVLFVDVVGPLLQCYEPSAGEVIAVDPAAVRGSRLTGLGYPHPFAFVLPQPQ